MVRKIAAKNPHELLLPPDTTGFKIADLIVLPTCSSSRVKMSSNLIQAFENHPDDELPATLI
ncbi:hypothetical protein AAD033_003591 [Vibrio parahaemolyticus]